jgi:hypothetical protein
MTRQKKISKAFAKRFRALDARDRATDEYLKANDEFILAEYHAEDDPSLWDRIKDAIRGGA